MFNGSPGSGANVVPESVYTRKILFKFRVKLQQCPPGFVFSNGKCACSLDNVFGIQGCDEEEFQAYLHSRYWVGYDPMQKHTWQGENFLASCLSFWSLLE